jgi:hypothetical protein
MFVIVMKGRKMTPGRAEVFDAEAGQEPPV